MVTASKNNWLYPVLLILAMGLISVLIIFSYQNKLNLPLPLYFLILLICDLAATALLTRWMNSSAEWSGQVMKGNLKITGSIVVFLLILGAGYRFRPTQEDPFSLTIMLFDPNNAKTMFQHDTIQIAFENLLREEPVSNQGEAVFLNVDSRYHGRQVHLLARMDGFRISSSSDTLIIIPHSTSAVIRIPVYPTNDSALFGGLVFKRKQNRSPIPIAGAVLHFTDFNRNAQTDSLGQFSIWLKAKAGEVSPVAISRNQKWIFTGKVALTKNIQILTDE
ncbi:MAG: hypothetical protein ACHQET_04305 [Chitinophagales bacterium]